MKEPECLTRMRLCECWGDNLNAKELKEVNSYINNLEEENQQLKGQLKYLRSGEYLNQLKFERNMLEDIVHNGEVSKEDKEFIDMTHRNTELLQENQQLKEQLQQRDEVIEKVYSYMNNCIIDVAKSGSSKDLKIIKEFYDYPLSILEMERR